MTSNVLSENTPRLIALTVLLVGTFFFGVLPIFVVKKLRKGQQQTDGGVRISRLNSMAISFLVCFGGGVLFATCFIHLLPEVRHTLENIEREHQHNLTNSDRQEDHSKLKHEHGLPLAELLMCAGFFAVYLVEEILHATIEHTHGRTASDSRQVVHGQSPTVLLCSVRDASAPKAEGQLITKGSSNGGGPQDYGSTSGNLEKKLSQNDDAKPDPNVPLSIKGLLIVVALSFHSVFEGLAIGLQTTEKDVWTMLTAVAMHKFVISFVVGLEVYQKGSRVLIVMVYMAVFSLMSPVGILVGLFTETSFSQNSPMVGYLTSLATGTLLYVTFFEVMQSEKSSDSPGLLQFFAVLVGFCTMVLFTTYFPS